MFERHLGRRTGRGNRLTDWKVNLKGLIVFFALALVILICAPAEAIAYSVSVQAGGETIDLEINPLPPGRIHIDASNPCHFNSETGVYYCELVLWDPSWTTEYTFSAKLTPVGSVYFARFSLSYYYDAAYKYGYLLDSYQCPASSKCTLNPAVQMFIPDDAEQFLFWYNSGTGTQIYVAINIAYSDGRSASYLGGPSAHDDIFFCGYYTQPGGPKKIEKLKPGEPGGSGRCMYMGLPRYWVNTAALSLVLEDTDFSYDGLGPQMRMTRTYNSNNMEQGMFGRGWAFSYESFVKSHLCFDALRQVALHRTTSDTLMYKADEFICSSGGLITPVPVTATPLMPPGNRDLLTWYPGESGGRNYWLYEDKKTFLKYRYEDLTWWASPPSPITLSVARLGSITDPSGNKVTIAYNDDKTIKSVTDAAGRVTTFAYNAQKRCTSMTLPNAKVVNYQYDASGRLAKAIDLMGNETVYTYDADGFMTSMTVGNKVTTFAYDDKNGTITPKRIASIIDAEGKTQTYEWALWNNSATDVKGNRSYYPASDVGQTIGTENPLGGETNLVYEQGLPTSYTDAMGYTTAMQYDARGNLTQKTLPGQRTTSYTYDAADNRISYQDGEGNTWGYQYDDKHHLTKLTRPSNNSTAYAYDDKGQLVTVTDDAGATKFSYDSYGNISVIEDPLGGKWRYTYDAKGILKTAETDPLNHTTSFAYDNNHRLTRITHADGAITQLQYDCCGLTGITNPIGNKVVIENNKVLKPVKVTDPVGNSTRYEYDATHNRIKTIDALSHATTITRDALYRPTAITDALGNTVSMAYNANWDRTSLTNARGKNYAFAQMDTLPFSIKDPLNATTYTWWDKNRRLSRWQNARGGGVDFRYTPDGDLASKTGIYPVQSIATYAYDTVRRLTSFTDPSGTTRYTYDAAGRITGVIWPDGRSVGFVYDAAGNVTSLAYPGGFTATYLYDPRNRVSSVSWAGNQVQLGYDLAGNLLQITRSNGTTTGQVFDKRNAVTNINHKKGTTAFAQVTLTRNALGHLVSESRTAPVYPDISAPSATATYNDADQLAQYGGNTFSFDADGNLITVRGTQTWDAVYDQMNRLSSITINSVKTDHVYDGLGNRAQTSTGSAVVKYHYDHLARLLFETDGANALRAVYFYADGQPIGIWTPTFGHLFYHYDQLGSTTALTDSTGNVVAAYAYEPFGKLSQSTGTAYNPFKYVGAYGVMDDGNGIYYMRNRHYDSATGHFLQKDPIGFAGGSNLYAYVGNNPVNFKDPSGLKKMDRTPRSRYNWYCEGIWEKISDWGIGQIVEKVIGWGPSLFTDMFTSGQEENVRAVKEMQKKQMEDYNRALEEMEKDKLEYFNSSDGIGISSEADFEVASETSELPEE